MTLVIISAIILALVAVSSAALYWHKQTFIVAEDSVSITINRDGFIKRVLPAGRHTLQPFEKVDFTVEVKTKLITGQAATVATADGVMVNLNWSGTYALRPNLISENISQRLRGLPNAEKAITRNADICLRKLVGDHTVSDLFKPALRERIERQLSQLLAERLKPMGIAFNGLNLQAINLPQEVAEALNKAKAIETLDSAIRQLDPTTREVVRGAYQLDEILHWDAYLPAPSRLGMKRLQTMAN